MQQKGSCALLRYGNTVFLIQRNPYYINNIERSHEYEIPGGKLDNAETYDDCIIREVFEETASTIRLTKTQLNRSWNLIDEIRPGTQIYLVELTDEQYSSIKDASTKLYELYNKEPKRTEGICIDAIPISDVIAYIKREVTSINGLPLRKYNTVVLKHIIDNI